MIECRLRRLYCPGCGDLYEAVPWARAGSRQTRDFEDLTAWLAQQMSQTQVTRLLRIGWQTVGKILARVVAEKLAAGRLDGLESLGVDEVSYGADHKFLTCVANHDSGGIVWAAGGRNAKSLQAFFDARPGGRTGERAPGGSGASRAPAGGAARAAEDVHQPDARGGCAAALRDGPGRARRLEDDPRDLRPRAEAAQPPAGQTSLRGTARWNGSRQPRRSSRRSREAVASNLRKCQKALPSDGQNGRWSQKRALGSRGGRNTHRDRGTF